MSHLDFNLLDQGGPMIWVLLGLGGLGLVLFIERVLYLQTIRDLCSKMSSKMNEVS